MTIDDELLTRAARLIDGKGVTTWTARESALAACAQDLVTEMERIQAESSAWKQAALRYRRIAADGVLRLKTGLGYAQAQDLYEKALAAEPHHHELLADTGQPNEEVGS